MNNYSNNSTVIDDSSSSDGTIFSSFFFICVLPCLMIFYLIIFYLIGFYLIITVCICKCFRNKKQQQIITNYYNKLDNPYDDLILVKDDDIMNNNTNNNQNNKMETGIFEIEMDNTTPKPIISEVKSSSTKRKNIPKSLREEVWINAFGKQFEGYCYVGCGNKIEITNFECGHIQPYSKGGSDTADNLRPICSKCNRSMSNKHMLDYMKQYNRICPYSDILLN